MSARSLAFCTFWNKDRFAARTDDESVTETGKRKLESRISSVKRVLILRLQKAHTWMSTRTYWMTTPMSSLLVDRMRKTLLHEGRGPSFAGMRDPHYLNGVLRERELKESILVIVAIFAGRSL